MKMIDVPHAPDGARQLVHIEPAPMSVRFYPSDHPSPSVPSACSRQRPRPGAAPPVPPPAGSRSDCSLDRKRRQSNRQTGRQTDRLASGPTSGHWLRSAAGSRSDTADTRPRMSPRPRPRPRSGPPAGVGTGPVQWAVRPAGSTGEGLYDRCTRRMEGRGGGCQLRQVSGLGAASQSFVLT